MAHKTAPSDDATAEYVSFPEFHDGLPQGRFHVIVNPQLAPPFVAQRINAVPVAIATIGIGIACALAGYAIVGAVLVAGGVLFRRVVKRQAAAILLQLASRQPATYAAAITTGVMEVRRRPAAQA